MKTEFVTPFMVAATEVLKAEVQAQISRGKLNVRKVAATAQEVTIMVGVTGDVMGAVFYGMPNKTACQIASAMLGQRLPIFDKMVESGIAELGNVITGRASMGLEQAGYRCRLTPPTIISGQGVIISTLEINQLVIPIKTQYGDFEIGVALRAATS
ncbi:MAG: chemotaxis protein CheX [Firmicutes bacterium]|nr:chemotaxis protein CheX [Bacillota bacterium]MDD4264699.1 chemotaxis protein CheX [Bacillota bacterium]MDD4693225.1 chemotaxis protein CheX [Bacillota bacterium]